MARLIVFEDVVVLRLVRQRPGDTADGQPELRVEMTEHPQRPPLAVQHVPAGVLEREGLLGGRLVLDIVPARRPRRRLGLVGGDAEVGA